MEFFSLSCFPPPLNGHVAIECHDGIGVTLCDLNRSRGILSTRGASHLAIARENIDLFRNEATAASAEAADR